MRNQRGYTLIEVMTTVALVAGILLAAGTLSTTLLKMSTSFLTGDKVNQLRTTVRDRLDCGNFQAQLANAIATGQRYFPVLDRYNNVIIVRYVNDNTATHWGTNYILKADRVAVSNGGVIPYLWFEELTGPGGGAAVDPGTKQQLGWQPLFPDQSNICTNTVPNTSVSACAAGTQQRAIGINPITKDIVCGVPKTSVWRTNIRWTANGVSLGTAPNTGTGDVFTGIPTAADRMLCGFYGIQAGHNHPGHLKFHWGIPSVSVDNGMVGCYCAAVPSPFGSGWVRYVLEADNYRPGSDAFGFAANTTCDVTLMAW